MLGYCGLGLGLGWVRVRVRGVLRYLARRDISAARESEVAWVIQRLLKQDSGHAKVVWDHTSTGER